MADVAARIAENVAQIRERIAKAAVRSGRSADEITLVAVTKYVDADTTQALVAAGCFALGESRPQQLWEKASAITAPGIQWHMIGHLQRNKVRRTLPIVALIHSVDSPRLAATIDEEASAQQLPPIPVLLEVNTSGESAKHGFQPDRIEPFLMEAARYRNITVRGLMCMAGLEGGFDEARHDFAALRELRNRLQNNCPPEISLNELSMGMSGDFEIAIEEGATIVRVGSALFDGI